MATSGSVDFTMTRTEIIEHSLSLLGVYGVGRTVSAEDMSVGVMALNSMIKSWQARGLYMWGREEAVLFLEDNVESYTLGNGSGDAKMALRSDAQVSQLGAAASSGATSLMVDSTTGMAASDNIGIVQDDDVVHWTTIVSVDSSTTLTITTGLAGDAAIDAFVYVFTSRTNKPLFIHDVRRVTGYDQTSSSTRTEQPMTELSHEEYFNLSNLTYSGVPTQWYYNPDISTGTFYVWPRPDNPDTRLHITFSRMLEDVDASTDEVDFPSEWLETIQYQLAVRLAPHFGRDEKLPYLMPIASSLLNDKLKQDTENASIKFKPNFRRG